MLHLTIRVWHRAVVGALEKYWRANPAAVVLSVIPNFNRALAESLRRATPDTKFVTLITDFADYPPHFWMEAASQYVICGTQKAVQQGLALGLEKEKLFLTSGMVLNPRFYATGKVDRSSERRRLGLRPELPTALVLFGGYGSPAMLRIAEALQSSDLDLQMIFICGHNAKLATRIREIPGKKPIFIEGFTKQVDYYMSISDFFIGKPGPGSIAEALHFNLPVIVERNACTMPQERYNAEWIQEHEVGVVLNDFRGIEAAVRDLLSGSKLQRLRANASAHQNRAVFEAVEILAGMMNGAGPFAESAQLQTAATS
jgi:1,2-diacylglycerol 3-beta-galactosyltransferase